MEMIGKATYKNLFESIEFEHIMRLARARTHKYDIG
jgi:hypothetical protein